MEEKIKPEQFNELKDHLNKITNEIDQLKNHQVIVQSNPNEKFIDTLLEKGAPIVMNIMELKKEELVENLKADLELEKQELQIINNLDTKEKVFKSIMLIICFIVLILSLTILPNGSQIVPVLTLIIGLLFKTNSLSDFFSHAKNKLKGPEE